MTFPVLLTIAALLCPAGASELLRTPFGLIPRVCVRGLPSGSHILATPAGAISARVIYPNGSVIDIASPPSCSIRRPGQLNAQGPSFWQGWPNHFWLGQNFGTAIDAVVYSLNSSWRVPAFPRNTLGNGSDPFSTSPPTLSWWIGIQGPTVLQPVLEFNGIMPGVFDAASWNCCPAGMAWYSFPLPASPGDLIVGGMIQVPASESCESGSPPVPLAVTAPAVRSSQPKSDSDSELPLAVARTGTRKSPMRPLAGSGLGGPYTFVVDTAVVTPTGRVARTTLTCDMAAEPGWNPTWAEAVFESWYATRCEHFPCAAPLGGYTLTDVLLSTTPAVGPLSPTPVTPVPWTEFYDVDNSTAPGKPVCDGATASSTNGSVSISLNCSAQHYLLLCFSLKQSPATPSRAERPSSHRR